MSGGKRQDDKAQRTPTMVDVARHAGVSSMTVSRALRGESYISSATRERILQAVKELGYVLDLSAGSLSSRRSAIVAAIIPSINNSNFSDTARGITDTLEPTGMQLMLGYTEYSIEREEKLLEAMLRRRPEGIILTGGAHTPAARAMLARAGVPVVETWDLPSAPIDQVVGFSNQAAMAALVAALAGQGYRRFGFIGGIAAADTRGGERREGFIEALGRFGLPADRLVAVGKPPISMQQGAEGVTELLARWQDTEVAVCVSDLSAFGALAECQRRGLRVPQDIAIAGFGDYEIASACHPRLSTVNVDCYGMGELAARRLLAALDGEAGTVTETGFRVVLREST